MALLFDNFISGTLNSTLALGATSMSSLQLADLIEVSGGDTLTIALDPLGKNGAPEIVTVTAHATSATTATITRAQESTVDREHTSGSEWVASPTTAGLLAAFPALTAQRWATARTMSLTGEVLGTLAGVDGSSPISIATTLRNAQNWTPTLSQSGSVAISTPLARKWIFGDLGIFLFRLDVTGTGTANNAIKVGGFDTFQSATTVWGYGEVYDSSDLINGRYSGIIEGDGSTNTIMFAQDRAALLGNIGTTIGGPSVTLASGDVVRGVVVAELA